MKVALILTLFALAGCTQTISGSGLPAEDIGPRVLISHVAVEQVIQQQGYPIYNNVICNGGHDPQISKGTTFACVDSAEHLILVTITSDAGNFAWSPQ